MPIDFPRSPRVEQWREANADFVTTTVIPREQVAFTHGVDDTLRVEPQQAATSAGIWAPQASEEGIVDRSVQPWGGMGTSEELVVGRIYADIRALRSYDGSSETHRMSITKRPAHRAAARVDAAEPA